MITNDLDATYSEFRNDMLVEAEASGEPQESVFFTAMSELASENGDCTDLTYTPARRDGPGGFRIDGYALDDDRGELHLAVSDFRAERELQTANADSVARNYARMRKFCELAVQSEFVNSLEETGPTFEAAYQIYRRRASIKRIRGVLFTNARISMRKKVAAVEVLNRPFTLNLFDFQRYHDILESRGKPEPIEIDVAELNGNPLPCLEAHVGGSDYRSYLVVMPGELLAKIYGLYGPRLLEQNVRTFLQARTKVNRGIIQTIDKSPEMFFAFNNGLTATAAGLKLETGSDGTAGIKSIRDLQIVNGGQTTASILYSHDRNKADLSSVFVQMKLSVVDADRIEEVVPLVSRFANTQNRISEADFFSSHPFHVEMERISRRIAAPAKAGSLAPSKWFYERVRGQYRDLLARGSASDRRKFGVEFPRDRTLQKTDLAKYQMTFDCKPYVVSAGAQKCFLAFAENVSKTWDKSPDHFNEEYFRRAIARTIIFRCTDRMIARSDWYQADRGYKANIVTYTVAYLVNRLAKDRNLGLDLALVWKFQEVPDELKTVLADLAPKVATIIKKPPSSIKNVTEYAKQQACWAHVSRADLCLSDRIDTVTVDLAQVIEDTRDAIKTRGIDRTIELETQLLRLREHIDDFEGICRKHRLLTPKSARAISMVRRSGIGLGKSDLNSIKALLARLENAGVDLRETFGLQ
ncbi:MAG: AIPR family protein [Albidovulum sp.]|nr:AIPR family protein [Albidovulum sp.]